jgi:hypothetical protein
MKENDRKAKWRKRTKDGLRHLTGGWVTKPDAERLQPEIDAAVSAASQTGEDEA